MKELRKKFIPKSRRTKWLKRRVPAYPKKDIERIVSILVPLLTIVVLLAVLHAVGDN